MTTEPLFLERPANGGLIALRKSGNTSAISDMNFDV